MDRSFFGRAGLHILAIFVCLLPITLLGAGKALKSNKNDVQDWLPQEYAETKQFNWFQQHFGGESFILISWDGCTLDDQRMELLDAKLSHPNAGGVQEKEPALFAQVLTGPEAISQLTSEPINLSREQALARLRGSLIGPDLQQTCVVATLSPYGGTQLRRSVETIEKVATEECGISRDILHLGGPPVDNVSIDRTGEQSLFRLAGLAGLIGLVVSWWCLRSGRLIAMVFTAGIYSAAASLALVWISGNSMNAILLTMPSLVYVAAISGAIHLSNYYRETLAEEGPHGAPGRAVKHAMLPVSLATGTTAVGLVTLAYSELLPIQQFGIFSAVGVLASMAVLVFFLPGMFQQWQLPMSVARPPEHDKPLLPDPMALPFWSQLGRGITRYPLLVTTGCLVFLGVCAWGFFYESTSIQMLKLFAGNAPIIRDYRWFEEHLGELVPMEVIVRIDDEECQLTFLERMRLVERIQKEVESIEQVGSALSMVTFAPRMPQPEDFKAKPGMLSALARIVIKNQYQTACRIFDKRISEHRDEFYASDYLRHVPGPDGGPGEELWRVSARVAALKYEVDYGAFVGTLEQRVEPILAEARGQGVAGVTVTYTGLVPLVYKAQRSLLDGLIQGFGMDLALITVAMIVALRGWTAGLLLLMPAIFPCVVVFGLMGWLGIPVDIGSVMCPAVALGVTVDDVVHFMIQYRNALAQGSTRANAVMAAYKHCARAMYQSWGVIGLGLSVFALSPFTPTQRFGVMMVTLLTAALVGNLLLLPALLAGPLGALFSWNIRKRLAREQAKQAARAAAAPVAEAAPAAESAPGGPQPHRPVHETRPHTIFHRPH